MIWAQEWKYLKKGMSLINIAELDSWLTLRKIAETFGNVLNTKIDPEFMSREDIENMASVMGMLRYEPVLKTEQNKDSYYYDDIQSFAEKMERYFR